MRIFLVGLVVFALTMAVYSREPAGRNVSRNRNVGVTRIAIGVPNWLTVTQHNVQGAQAPIDPHLLREAEVHQTAWHVRILLLLASLVGSFILAAVVYGLGIVFKRGRPGNHHRRVLIVYVIGLIAAVGVGAIIPTDPQRGFAPGLEWIGTTLGLAFLPACLILSATRLRSYWHAACLGLNMCVAVLWSQRVVDLFRSNHFVQGMPTASDLIAGVFVVSIFMLVGIISTFITNLIVRWNTSA